MESVVEEVLVLRFRLRLYGHVSSVTTCLVDINITYFDGEFIIAFDLIGMIIFLVLNFF